MWERYVEMLSYYSLFAPKRPKNEFKECWRGKKNDVNYLLSVRNGNMSAAHTEVRKASD